MKLEREKNIEILNERVTNFNNMSSLVPRVGDYLKLDKRQYTRFTHAWFDGIQAGGEAGSYYLGDGYCSYSGGLTEIISYEKIKLTKKTKTGLVWFFNNDWHEAHNGVHFEIEFRVYEMK
jgi:hypothetical protein